MTPHDAAVLGIRFAALYAGYQTLEYSSGIAFAIYQMMTPGSQPGWPVFVVYLLFFLLFAIITVALFRKAPVLADYIVLRSAETTADSSSMNAASVGFAIVGLAGLVFSTQRFVVVIVQLLQSELFRGAASSKQDFILHLPQMLGAFAQTILSFLVLLNSQALARWWQHKQG